VRKADNAPGDRYSGAVSPTWSVYLVECADGSWYTGIATDVERRIDEHNRGRGARYTRGRGPVALVAQRSELTRSEALKLEHRIKRLRRSDKLAALVET